MNVIRITQREHDIVVWNGDSVYFATRVMVDTQPHGDVVMMWNARGLIGEIYLAKHIHKIDVTHYDKGVFMTNELANDYALHLSIWAKKDAKSKE